MADFMFFKLSYCQLNILNNFSIFICFCWVNQIFG